MLRLRLSFSSLRSSSCLCESEKNAVSLPEMRAEQTKRRIRLIPKYRISIVKLLGGSKLLNYWFTGANIVIFPILQLYIFQLEKRDGIAVLHYGDFHLRHHPLCLHKQTLYHQGSVPPPAYMDFASGAAGTSG